MSKPIKTYVCGNVSCGIFENEYEGKKNYSYSFQRRAVNPKTKEAKYTSFFTPASMNELNTLINFMANKQVKDLATLTKNKPKQNNNKEQNNQSNPAPKPTNDKDVEEFFNADAEAYNDADDVPF